MNPRPSDKEKRACKYCLELYVKAKSSEVALNTAGGTSGSDVEEFVVMNCCPLLLETDHHGL